MFSSFTEMDGPGSPAIHPAQSPALKSRACLDLAAAARGADFSGHSSRFSFWKSGAGLHAQFAGWEAQVHHGAESRARASVSMGVPSFRRASRATEVGVT